ncbi:MAG TPA: hypothetical protein DGH68_03850 [Bacteroidetes bacterium]|nr:hypothetical protein [Bacteroidota bacterium]
MNPIYTIVISHSSTREPFLEVPVLFLIFPSSFGNSLGLPAGNAVRRPAGCGTKELSKHLS